MVQIHSPRFALLPLKSMLCAAFSNRLQLRLYGQYGHVTIYVVLLGSSKPCYGRVMSVAVHHSFSIFRSRSPRPRFESFRPTRCPPAIRHGAKVR